MKPVIAALGTFLFGLTIFEIVMRPSWAERGELGSIFLVMALAMALANWWLPRWARRNKTIRSTVAALGLTGFLIVVGGAVAVADRMFVSRHDLTLLLVVLAFGMVSAVVFAIAVSRTITSDLDVVADGASRVAGGAVDIRVTLERRDELGRLALAIDQMIRQLELAETQRQVDAEGRRHFFAAVGHDLRTPLASLRSAIEALEDGLVDEPARYLESMGHDVEALSRLVDDVFLLARIDTGQLQIVRTSVDLTELVDETIDLLRPLAENRGVTVRLITATRVIASGTDEALSRVMRNLIDNAIRHAPESSEVTVEVIGGSDVATVRVSDEGDGFSKEFIPAAFDRFTRGDTARARSSGGSGLGLAIARGYVAALGGEIWAEPGPGGKVGFRLPVGA